MGVRIHALAKELRMSSKELMAYLRTQGHTVKSHMSAIDETVANILRDRIKPKLPPKPPPAKSAGRAGEATGGRPKTAGPGGGRGAAPSSSGTQGRGPARPGTRPATTGGGGREGRDGNRGRTGTGSDGRTRGRTGPRRVRFFPEDDPSVLNLTRSQGRNRRGRPRPGRASAAPPTRLPDSIAVTAPVTVKDLSAELGVKAQVLIGKLFSQGLIVTINQTLDEDQVLALSTELGVEITIKSGKEAELEDAIKKLEEYGSQEGNLEPRAPIVTFLGHVDHGKTSLLDKIRQSNVTSTESGGITQHIGAYRIDKGKSKVTFIDTPGHKAFTEMRARGANVTDLAVLVVAADDGPMPQTEEALNHARAAGVKVVVALNKIDKPEANLDRAKQELTKLQLMPAEWHGDTEFVPVSAITGQGIDDLLEVLSLEAEILELKADPTRPAIGVVLEAEATANRGSVVTVLVQDGTLKVGDYVLCGTAHGRVKNLILNDSQALEEAPPSYPVKLIGLHGAPEAGTRFYVFEDEKQARQIAGERERQKRARERVQRPVVNLENFLQHMGQEDVAELRLILKADGQGSVEALRDSLQQLDAESDEVRVTVLHGGVGAISQEDINLATASQAVVVGYHVTPDERARALAEENGVDIRLYTVIYKALEDIRAALEARLSPEEEEQVRGHAEIRQVYRASRVGNIAGCMVTSGVVGRSDKVRLTRDGRIVYTGDLSSLKRFKDDTKEVKEGFECGIKISGYEDIKVGDVIEAFVVVQKQRNL